MTGAITWDAVAYLVGTGGAVAGVWFFLYRQIEHERQSRILEYAVLKAELAAFQLRVAEKYATNDTVKQVADAINRISDRLDRVLLELPRNPA